MTDWRKLWVFVLLVAVGGVEANSAWSQELRPKVSFPIQVNTEAGGTQGLTLGIDSNATEGIDESFGEEERPPPPPRSIFDARLIDRDISISDLGQGVVVDIRPGEDIFEGQKKHQIQFQASSEADSITFSWALPPGVTGTLEDVLAGASYGPVEMEGRDSLTVESGAPDAVVTVNYSGDQPRANFQVGEVTKDGQLSFTNAGAFLKFAGVNQEGRVLVRRFGNGPNSREGIEEERVSDYRFVIESERKLRFESAELKLAVSTLGGVIDPSTTRIYKRDESGTGTFIPLETSVDDGGTPGNISDDTISVQAGSLSEFVLASDSDPLPVELASLTAAANGTSVLIEWKTASEQNSAGFQVQRKTDESGWRKLGYVESKASSSRRSDTTTYQYKTEDLPVGTHRFRLRQIDVDGRSAVHGPVAAQVRMEKAVKLTAPVPNPVQGSGTLFFAVKEPARTTVCLYNTLGQQVAMLYEGTPQVGERQFLQVDATELPSSTYFVRLQSGGKTTTQQFTVVR